MQVEQIKDILDWVADFHLQMGRCYERCANQSGSERVKMLLKYLAAHEKSLAGAISKYETIAEASLLNTWFYDYMDKAPLFADIMGKTDLNELSIDEIVRKSIDLHEQLIGLYRYLLGRSATDSQKALFEDLIQLEHHEAMRMVRDAESLGDL